MSEASTWETLDELKEAGASYDQLRRWRGHNLIPSPWKPGLGRGRGSVSLYPAGTVAIVVRIQELLEERRNLDFVGWRLWLEGYPVAAFVKHILEASVSSIEVAAADLEDRFEAAIDDPALMDRLKPPAGLGWMRLTMKPEHYPVLLAVVVHAFRGFRVPVTDPEEAKAFRRLIDRTADRAGFGPVLTEKLKERGELETLTALPSQLLPGLQAFVEGLTENDLYALRDETDEVEKLWMGMDREFDHSERVDLTHFLLALALRMRDISLVRFAEAAELNERAGLLVAAIQAGFLVISDEL